MPRPKAAKPRIVVREQTPEQVAYYDGLRAELDRRLTRLRGFIDEKRRRAGYVEISEGVWIRPEPADAAALTNPTPDRSWC